MPWNDSVNIFDELESKVILVESARCSHFGLFASRGEIAETTSPLCGAQRSARPTNKAVDGDLGSSHTPWG